jgi:hypothetical protein
MGILKFSFKILERRNLVNAFQKGGLIFRGNRVEEKRGI